MAEPPPRARACSAESAPNNACCLPPQDASAGGECVSWCCFVEQDIRIGGASVIAADVTGVGTWKHRRRNGYSSIVIEAALAYMKQLGMHVTSQAIRQWAPDGPLIDP